MEHLTKNDIEFYLLNFEYKELNDDQLAIVDEEVKSEEEYNSLRNFMLAYTAEEEALITPSTDLKARLIQEFAQANSKGFWASSALFLFPKHKPAYARPGIQLLAIAASILLIFTVFINYEQAEPKLAFEKTTEPKINQPQNEVNQAEKSNNAERNDQLNSVLTESNQEDVSGNQQEVNDIDSRNDIETTQKIPLMAEESKEKEIQYNMSVSDDELEIAEEAEKSDAESLDFKDIESVSVSAEEDQVITGYTQPTTETFSNSGYSYSIDKTSSAPASTSRSAETLKKEKATDLPVNSRTLSQEKSLIGVLYTAM